MKLDGIEKEVVIINPYRYNSKLLQNKPIQSYLTEVTNLKTKQNDFQNPTLSQQQMNQLLEELRDKFSMLNKYLQINIDEILKIPISKIIDMKTEEVIRQIPPEWLVEILRRMEELKGIFYSKEA